MPTLTKQISRGHKRNNFHDGRISQASDTTTYVCAMVRNYKTKISVTAHVFSRAGFDNEIDACRIWIGHKYVKGIVKRHTFALVALKRRTDHWTRKQCQLIDPLPDLWIIHAYPWLMNGHPLILSMDYPPNDQQISI